LAIFLLSALAVVFLWWFTTGALLWIDRRPAQTFPRSIGALGVAALISFAALPWLSADAGLWGVGGGFLAALVIWGFNELLFLTGTVTGPRRISAPEGAEGLPRFVAAVQALLWHELALIGSGLLILLLSTGGGSRTTLWTFGLMWLMRLSSKFNLYLGVPNTGDEFLPPPLSYLKTYFRQRRMNPLFPVSLIIGLMGIGMLAASAFAPQPAPQAAEAAALATLALLGLAEHLFMVLPVRSARLWAWAIQDIPATKEPLGMTETRVVPSVSKTQNNLMAVRPVVAEQAPSNTGR
jgi:putative photosynthetic complex assembly protein 2